MKHLLLILLLSIFTLAASAQSIVPCDRVSLRNYQFEVTYPGSTINDTLFYKGDTMLVYHTIMLEQFDTSVVYNNYFLVGSSMRYPQDSTEPLHIPIQFKNQDFTEGQQVQGRIYIYDSDISGDSVISCRIPVTLILRHGATAIQPTRSTGPEIFPNPATNSIRIHLPDGEIDRVELTALDGRSVLKREGGSASAMLETGSLSPGIYMVVITSPAGRYVRKIVKE